MFGGPAYYIDNFYPFRYLADEIDGLNSFRVFFVLFQIEELEREHQAPPVPSTFFVFPQRNPYVFVATRKW